MIVYMERYRSGHNGADSKSVCAQAHEGSNPSLSAKTKSILKEGAFCFRREYKRDSNAEKKVNLNIILEKIRFM